MKSAAKKNKDSLATKRKEIDKIDSQLAALLVKRFDLAAVIGQIKKEAGTPVIDNGREEEIVNRLVQETGLSKELLASIYELIFRESQKRQ